MLSIGPHPVSLQINGSSSVLRCYNGMALAKMNRHSDAIKYLKEAIKADPQNPLARFELAGVLVTAGHLEEALQELLSLKVAFCIQRFEQHLPSTDKRFLELKAERYVSS